MKKPAITLLFLLLSCVIFAQDDLDMKVKKTGSLSISPDSMFFYSHTPRTFTIHGIPRDSKLKCSFTAGNLYVHDSVIRLEPFYVYKDSDVSRLESKYFNGFKTTKGEFYDAVLNIQACDLKGEVKASLTRKCFIRNGPHPRNVQLSAATLEPAARNLMKFINADSAVMSGPGK